MIETNNYPCAYKEVIELLRYVSISDIEKIPRETLQCFVQNMDEEYEYTINTGKCFAEQPMLEETKAIFANLYRDYWASPAQREAILKREQEEKIAQEQKEISIDIDEISSQTTELITYKTQNIFQRLFSILKNLFYKSHSSLK